MKYLSLYRVIVLQVNVENNKQKMENGKNVRNFYKEPKRRRRNDSTRVAWYVTKNKQSLAMMPDRLGASEGSSTPVRSREVTLLHAIW